MWRIYHRSQNKVRLDKCDALGYRSEKRMWQQQREAEEDKKTHK